MLCEGHTVLSRRNYAYGINTLDGEIGENMMEMINVLIAKINRDRGIIGM